MKVHAMAWVSVWLLGLAGISVAQQGDREGHNMVDPIPLDSIPASPYLGLEDALQSFVLADGYVIEPVAAGEDVDLVVALAFDADGRAWTCEMRSYMPDLDGKGEETPNGRIRVLEDTDGDGRLDRATTFLAGLVLPRAVAVMGDGCLYTNGDALWFMQRKGLQPVGQPILVDAEYAKGGNVEHKANGLLYGHDNWYYNAKSDKRYRRIDGVWVREKTDYRGQWGISKDDWGRLYHNNNSTLVVGDWFGPQFFRTDQQHPAPAKMARSLGSNRVYPIRITPGVNRAYMAGILGEDGRLVNTTAACGLHIYRGDNFPKEHRGMAFVCEPSGELIKAVGLQRDAWNRPSGNHPFGEQEFLASTDEWFLPCNLYTGPDGTLWLVDMYFGLLQHKTYMTTYLRKQYEHRGLDKPEPSTGRIYRVRYKANEAKPGPKLGGLSAEQLVPYLAHANGLIRDTAQRRIVEQGDLSSVEALNALVADSGNPFGQVHALWTLQGLGMVEATTTIRALADENPSVVNAVLDIVAESRRLDSESLAALNKLPWKAGYGHGLVRALAARGQAQSAYSMVNAHLDVPLIREAFVSGLGSKSVQFHLERGPFEDAKLTALLEKMAPVLEAPGDGAAPLSGEAKNAYGRGRVMYETKAACSSCHGPTGDGLPNLGPPLRNSEWVTGDVTRLTKILLHGMTGPVTVAGTKYTPLLPMPGIGANRAIGDQDVADLITYIRNSWGNHADVGEADEVEKVRAATTDRRTPYKESDLR
ncbi:MAG: c-type cytochrome [Planctomycetota bacterium]|nr:c-type cytochrome [Planctomycetota bacterium]